MISEYEKYLDRNTITELNGRVKWRSPGLTRHWASTSEEPAKLAIINKRDVRLLGKWGGVIRGVQLGRFSSHEMALEALKLISEDVPLVHVLEPIQGDSA